MPKYTIRGERQHPLLYSKFYYNAVHSQASSMDRLDPIKFGITVQKES